MLSSILIPCFNAERWIAASIESALAQTWAEKEVIVVDDGSSDGSLSIIKSFADRIRWETGPNRGSNSARNRLLELARGEWLQYLDADDYLQPEKLARQIRFLAAYPDADVVFGPVILERWDNGTANQKLLSIPQPHDLWVLLAQWRLPQTGATLWRKRAIEDVGGWNPEQMSCQEHELYLRLLIAAKRFVYCDDNGAVYRQWSDTTLWQRDRRGTRRRRLEIEQRAEDFLRQRDQLSAARQAAINQARFTCARSAWQDDRALALAVDAAIKRTQPRFVPEVDAASAWYRVLYRRLGFARTERLADLRRRLLGRIPRFLRQA